MKRNVLIAIALIGLMAITSYTGNAKAIPNYHSNVSIIETDVIMVQLFNRQPHFLVWLKGENETVVYFVKLHNLIEFLDEDNNGIFEPNETIYAIAPFMASNSYWTTGNWLIDHEIIETDDYTELRVILSNQVPVFKVSQQTEEYSAMDGYLLGKVNVSFVIHVYDKDVDVNGTLVKGNMEIKFDVVIEDWPWVKNDTSLGLSVIIGGKGTHDMKMRHEKKTVKYGEKAENRHIVRGEGVKYSLYFGYGNKAEVRNGVPVNVKGSMNSVSDMNKRIGTGESGLGWIVITYPHFNGTLVHDPTIGISTTSATINLFGFELSFLEVGAILGLILIATTVVIVSAKRK